MSDLLPPARALTVHPGRRPGRRWTTVARGLHHPPGLTALHAWQHVLPASAAFSHLTAAGLHGWWLPQVPPDLPVLVDQAEADHRTRRPGVRVTRTTSPVPVLERDGLRVAVAPHTLLPCARDLALLDLVVLVDSALRSGCTVPDIEAVCAPRRRGVVALRRAVALADGRSESPWESLLRLMHVTLGADVVPQHPVHRASGELVARGDLWITGTTTLHEYDGAVHRDAQQHAADLRRDRALTSIGWTRRGYASGDLRDRPVSVLRDIDDALGREHVPERVRPWLDLLAASTFTAAGRTRLARRLTRP
ncbi:hypothetical protein [Cellulomonas wangsupingiae]|uniref:hypothetical protein n=1 Tax=Cellulomonas wangsupingiae TaxID=2968085 RepID=UPI001D0E856F|nr:hypothetical protein [Cellulomonas wangsupingiae]MCM0639983.1 hypothetical protein [Cellulomonas wangsupingiae]